MFDFPNKCSDYHNNYQHFNDERAGRVVEYRDGKAVVLAAGDQNRLDAHKLRRGAVSDERYIARLNVELANLIAAKDAETDPAQVKYYNQKIAEKRNEITVSEGMLATKKTALAAKCLLGYPVDENLGQDDDRYYRVANSVEVE